MVVEEYFICEIAAVVLKAARNFLSLAMKMKSLWMLPFSVLCYLELGDPN